MSEQVSNNIYCPSCGAEHPWLGYLQGQEFQCECGYVLNMPKLPSESSPKPAPDKQSFSLDALVNDCEFQDTATHEADVVEEEIYELAVDAPTARATPKPAVARSSEATKPSSAALGNVVIAPPTRPGMTVCSSCKKHYPVEESKCPFCGNVKPRQSGQKIKKSKKS